MFGSLRRFTTVVATSAALFAGVGAVAATSAQAATQTAVAGKGQTFGGNQYHPGAVNAREWSFGKLTGFLCYNFGKKTGDAVKLVSASGSLTDLAADKAARVITLTNQLKMLHDPSAETIANYQLAVWWAVHDSMFVKWLAVAMSNNELSNARVQLIQKLADVDYGPFSSTLTAKPAYVGQATTATLTVLGHDGKAAPANMPVSVSGTHIKILSASKATSAAGTFKVSFRPTDMPVTIQAVALVPSWKKATLNVPSSNQRQHMAAGSTTQKITATATYTQQLGAPTIQSACDSNCKGVAPITLTTPENPAGSLAVVWTWRDNATNAVLASVQVPAGTSKSVTASVADGVNITSGEYYYVDSTGKRVTKVVKLSGTTEVVCPPATTTFMSAGCDCSGTRTGTVLIKVPASVRFYQAVITVNGNQLGNARTLTSGSDNTFDIGSLQVGDKIMVAVSAYRDQAATTLLRSWPSSGMTVN